MIGQPINNPVIAAQAAMQQAQAQLNAQQETLRQMSSGAAGSTAKGFVQSFAVTKPRVR